MDLDLSLTKNSIKEGIWADKFFIVIVFYIKNMSLKQLKLPKNPFETIFFSSNIVGGPT